MSAVKILCLVMAPIFVAGCAVNSEEYRKAYNPTVDMSTTDKTIDQQSVGKIDKRSGNGKITYMREEIPDFEIPRYRGDRYEDKVPDTLDLAERARLAIHGMTESSDPDLDYEVYAFSSFDRDPPVLMHRYGNVAGLKYHETLPLMRLISGTHDNAHVDRSWMASTLKSVGPDGLYYWKTEGRMPWLRQDMEGWSPFVCWDDGTVSTVKDHQLTQFTEPLLLTQILAAMTLYSLRDQEPFWDATIKQMIDRLSELAICREDYCYYPFRIWAPISNWPANLAEQIRNIEDGNRHLRLTDDGEPIGTDAAELTGRLVWGLTQYYKQSHYEPARALAEKLADYVRFRGRYYDEHGHFGNPSGAAGDFIENPPGHFQEEGKYNYYYYYY